jgi:ribosomal protein S18 acetylase RimI-like enzyme
MAVTEIQDSETLRALLAQDKVGNAYLLGYLDPAYAPFSGWFGFHQGDQLQGLVLLYTGLRLPALMMCTPQPPSEARAILDQILTQIRPRLPEQLWVHARDAHKPVLARHFYCERPLSHMIRMGLTRPEYRPRGQHQAQVRRLGHADTAAIIDLYKHYPDNFFEPYQLESGLYFGVDRGGDLGIAAIAGVHLVSKTYDIAAIGNVMTHPDCRKRGYASAVTRRLLEELFKLVSLVTLNVRRDNAAATALFEKFGFVHHHTYHEGMVESLHAG